MKQSTSQGIEISSITFNEHGEMVVLDAELLHLISGGAGPKPPTPVPVPPIGSDNNALCGINVYCPGNPQTPPTPKPR
ncbi:hypothetical protein [Janthinobacterium fluminis]|uniref:Uncharacterized protein n=1 Tax=Janthinobacterium fluminis TaxID=2987524 RepID=A0ABT5JZJ3_9BURK|nr:hypothetical protein [Janthinobacterium fluminis]MDC8757481.1 hypothetical protein [Janthinobacterium fluminis]